MTQAVTEEHVREELAGILDPCSISAGAPLSIIDMGLVLDVDVSLPGIIKVNLRLTSPGCLFGVTVFEPEIKRRLSALRGATKVEVDIHNDGLWTESDITPRGRQKLLQVRKRRLDQRQSEAS